MTPKTNGGYQTRARTVWKKSKIKNVTLCYVPDQMMLLTYIRKEKKRSFPKSCFYVLTAFSVAPDY